MVAYADAEGGACGGVSSAGDGDADGVPGRDGLEPACQVGVALAAHRYNKHTVVVGAAFTVAARSFFLRPHAARARRALKHAEMHRCHFLVRTDRRVLLGGRLRLQGRECVIEKPTWTRATSCGAIAT